MSDETTGTTEETTWLGPWQYDPSEEDGERTRRGFHPLQTGYLVVGLLALGIALMWLLIDAGVM
jgi:hypothetical protein